MSSIIDHLLVVKPTLNPAAIQPENSLTADLGFDSLDLVELGNSLTNRYQSIDLSPWLAEAMDPGGDRVASLAAYLLNHIRATGEGAAPASGTEAPERTADVVPEFTVQTPRRPA